MPAHKIYHTEEERLAAVRLTYKKYRNSKKGQDRTRRFVENHPEMKTDPVYKAKIAAWQKKSKAKWTKEQKKKEAMKKAEIRSRSPEAYMLYDAKKRAKKKGLPFNLTIDDIVFPTICPVLGISMFKDEAGRTGNSPSLDRIDNSKGYIKGNVKVISFRANTLKNNATTEELRKIILYMENHNGLVRD